jgi:hypothetical protein
MGINIVYNLSNQETKAFISNKIALAAEYYKNKAVYYYGRFTGQIPSDYILQHSREWRQFAPVCDALVLDSHQSEYLFHIFVQSRNEVFNAIMAEVPLRTIQPTRLGSRDFVPSEDSISTGIRRNSHPLLGRKSTMNCLPRSSPWPWRF